MYSITTNLQRTLNKHRYSIAKLALLVLSIPFLKSCSAFQKTVDFDMQPFSDNTTVLFHEAAKVDRPFQFKSLATYKDIEPYKKLKQEADPILYGLKGITYYSNQLVAISNSSMSEKGKNQQLAIYVREILEKVEHRERIDSLGLSYAQVDSTIQKIKKAKDYRAGIKAADPVAKTVVLSMYERLDKLEGLIEETVEAFEDQIYADNELAIENYLTFKELQNSTQYRITQLYKAQSGISNSLDSLIQADQSLAKFFKPEWKPTDIGFQKAEAFLLTRLENIECMLRQLDDDKKEFIDMKREIGEWHMQADEKIKITRNSLIVWSQSHKNLGEGIVTPAILGIENIANVIIPAISSML